jgi:hypothetical protein
MARRWFFPPRHPYACHVCGWQGTLEPSEPAQDAVCPECGGLLFPQRWIDTWGHALLVAGVVVAVLTVLFALR